MKNITYFCLFIVLKSGVFGFRCDRRPYGSITKPSAADGRFKLTVVGAEDTYLPDQLYTGIEHFFLVKL